MNELIIAALALSGLALAIALGSLMPIRKLLVNDTLVPVIEKSNRDYPYYL